MVTDEFPNVKITIIKTDRKTLSIQLKKGEIIARAPKKMKDEDIFSFINSKKNWIKKHLDTLCESQAESAEPWSEEELKALAQKALEIIPERVKFYAEKIGVTYGRITTVFWCFFLLR